MKSGPKSLLWILRRSLARRTAWVLSGPESLVCCGFSGVGHILGLAASQTLSRDPV